MDIFTDFIGSSKYLALYIGLLGFIFKILTDYYQSRAARKLVLKAEREAFHIPPEELEDQKGAEKLTSEQLAQRARDIENLIKQSRESIQVGRLFDLYSKQIEKYQTETQARAGWSFIFAILSMLAGLGFVVGGGIHVITNPGWEHVAAASAISGIGGAVGAFITKTFLDVHRLSLSQLNHYFRQPVVNAHVLTGQRLADQIEDPLLRQQAYQHLLMQVASLIREETAPVAVWSSEPSIAPQQKSL